MTADASPATTTTVRAAVDVLPTSRATRSPSGVRRARSGPAARTWSARRRRSRPVVTAVPLPDTSWDTTSDTTTNPTSAAVAVRVPPAADQVGAPERAAVVTS